MEITEIMESAKSIFEAWKIGGEDGGRAEYDKIMNENNPPLYAILGIVREFRKLTINQN